MRKVNAKSSTDTKSMDKANFKKRPRKKRKREETAKSSSSGVEVTSASRDNDVSWYARNPEILRSAASLPFSQSLGVPVTIPATEVTAEFNNNPAPGLFVLRYVPTPGSSPHHGIDNLDYGIVPGYNAPVNVAARNVYSFVRHANSGHANYDAPNLMIYLLAMDSAYSFYSLVVKIYGMLRLYSFRNRYLPETVVKACGFNFSNLMGRMAEFRYYINTFAAKASAMCVPAIMSYFDRHFWLTQNLFCDGMTSKAQMYMFCPHFLWKGKLDPSAAFTLIPTDKFEYNAATGGLTLDDITRIGNDILNPLLINEDFNIMSGDILKAYGRENLYSLSPIDENYSVVPVYSEEVLTQIHNSRALHVKEFTFATSGTPSDTTVIANQGIGEQVYGSTSYISTNMLEAFRDTLWNNGKLMRGFAGLSMAQMLNSHKDDVTPEDVMVMTRLMPAVRTYKYKGASDSIVTRYSALGTEFVTRYEMYVNDYTDPATPELKVYMFGSNINPDIYTDAEIHAIVKYHSMFNQAPILAEFSAKGPSLTGNALTPVTLLGWIGDMENYTTIDCATLERIHETALLSEFAVPYVGSF